MKPKGSRKISRKKAAKKMEEGLSPLSTGKNYILAIGIDEYYHVAKLSNAVRDAQAFIELLVEKYQFDEEHTYTLFNDQATERNIEKAVDEISDLITPSDNLVIYYSGHGHYDEKYDEGFWIPVDAEYGVKVDYISYSFLTKAIRAVKSRHTFLIADACYSGTLFSEVRDMEIINRLEKDPSRWLLASGRNEVVPDGRIGGNSPFAEQLLDTLSRYASEGIRVSNLVEKVTTATVHNSRQTPIGRPMQGVGDKGGEFFFYPKGMHREITEAPVESSTEFTQKSGSNLIRKPSFWQRYNRWIILGIYLIAAVIGGWLSLQSRKSLSVRMQIHASRVQFNYIGGARLDQLRRMKHASIQKIKSSLIPVDTLRLIDPFSGQERALNSEEGFIELQAEPMLGDATIQMDDVYLTGMEFSKGATIALSLNEQEKNQLQIDIQQSQYTSADFSIPDSLQFTAELVYLKGTALPGDSLFEGLSAVVDNRKGGNNLSVIANPGSSTFYLTYAPQEVDSLKDAIDIEVEGVEVSDIQFSKRESQVAVSSILSGKIELLDTDSEPYDSFTLNQGESFYFSPVDSIPAKDTLKAVQLMIQSDGIHLVLEGEVDYLLSGTGPTLRNPSWIEWIWYNKRLELLLVGIFLLGLIFFVPGKSQKRIKSRLTSLWGRK